MTKNEWAKRRNGETERGRSPILPFPGSPILFSRFPDSPVRFLSGLLLQLLRY